MVRKIVDLRGRDARFLRERSKTFSRKPEKEKKTSLYERRWRMRIMIALLVLTLLGAAVYIIDSISYHPRLSIQVVTVQGVHDISEQEVRDVAYSILNDQTWRYISPRNMFFFPSEDIVDKILTHFPRIRSVTVARESSLSQTLVIKVEERLSYARWCAKPGVCYFMDYGGFIYAPIIDATSTRTLPYTFVGGFTATTTVVGLTLESAHMPGIRAILDQLGQSGFTVNEIAIVSSDDFSVLLDSGIALKLAYGADVNSTVQNLVLVLNSDDLRGKKSQIE